ncbi:MAG: phospholipid carrier-dependent glycosyltransferase, partial [Rhodoferax sp.]|nr:phospholipid carrier-dependent glycosyltransferase [Rhodoferax sp.]
MANLVPALRGLTLLVLLANAAGLLTPVVDAGDSVTYAALAQHMAVTGDWVNLMLDGQDWLDKPHFPFWLTALSFRLFGVSAFSYNLPGFLFHLLAAACTYGLARRWHGRQTAWLAVLVFVSAFQVMLTSSAVRAEAYLTGSITAACLAWLRYHDRPALAPLLLGAFFSATALMTKGVFTLITITSGLLALWIWQRRWDRLWSLQWWAALALTLLFTLPEMVALYLQFDAQPDKQVFGRTGVSGIGFFWWDSQFGRFFNTGPIRNADGSPFFFLHVFLWAFLPWVPVFFAALGGGPRRPAPRDPGPREARVFLWASFGVTFALFSLTRFQLDYYTVILFPFAAILCAPVLADALERAAASRRLAWAQAAMGCLGALLALGMAAWVGQPALPALLGGLVAVAGVAAVVRWRGPVPG